jgi:acyl transferase domain-containing protein
MVALKRYEDAIRDGDKIYGVLMNVHTNNAGGGMPLAPMLSSEVDCFR